MSGAPIHTHVAFHLTGRTFDTELETAEALDLRPASLAPYRELTSLRYDFPLILVRSIEVDRCCRPLSSVIDEAAHAVADEELDARLVSDARRVEGRIRQLVDAGERGPLSVLWEFAVDALMPAGDALFREHVKRLRAAISIDGELVDCDAQFPMLALTHAWMARYETQAHAFRQRVSTVIRRLSDILRADFVRSAAGRAPAQLRSAVGTRYEDAFDFEALSSVLGFDTTLDERRRHRIEGLIRTLNEQRVFAADSMALVFDSCASALAAYQDRAANLGQLANALAIAELELRGEYRESHDSIFMETGVPSQFESSAPWAPSYLIRLQFSRLTGDELAMLMEMLARRLPIKVLLQTDDLLEDSPAVDGQLGLDVRSRQIVQMAIALADVHVVQTPASHLNRSISAIATALESRDPALFSVFSGSGSASDLPPYVVAAAALESRAFPILTFDPAGGPDWPSRLSLVGNPQSDIDWPVQWLTYEDDRHQEVRRHVPFTLADFIACDDRHARHFARVPRRAWTEQLVGVAETLDHSRGTPDRVPSLTVVDASNVVHKVIVNDAVMRETRRCRQAWRSLQQLAGPTMAAHALAPEAETISEPIADVPSPGPASRPPVTSEDPYIETPRCSTCNECTRINDRMFAYNENRQAFIADANAGTYAQLVEAAESCQLSIIHPGKPRNSQEPGLVELVERAAPFM